MIATSQTSPIRYGESRRWYRRVKVPRVRPASVEQVGAFDSPRGRGPWARALRTGGPPKTQHDAACHPLRGGRRAVGAAG